MHNSLGSGFKSTYFPFLHNMQIYFHDNIIISYLIPKENGTLEYIQAHKTAADSLPGSIQPLVMCYLDYSI